MNIHPPEGTWINSKVETRKSETHGRGMFAVSKINEGEPIVTWGVPFVNASEAEIAKKTGKLVMQWDDDLYSIEDRGTDPGYFINHSCDPNIWMKDHFTLTARRKIEIGEEITADYALWETNENYVSEWECKCGSPLCRRKVTGKDWKLQVLQEKYRNHFSPLINKKIKTSTNMASGRL